MDQRNAFGFTRFLDPVVRQLVEEEHTFTYHKDNESIQT